MGKSLNTFKAFLFTYLILPFILNFLHSPFAQFMTNVWGNDFLIWHKHNVMLTGENSSLNQVHSGHAEHSSSNATNKKKLRMVVQKGMEYIPLFVKDIVLIYTENKLTFVLDKDGRKYISEKNLGDLSNHLDKEKFFRANRQYIVNMEYIRCYRSYGRSKLQVEVALMDHKHIIIISQENTPHFRNWISEA